ncbi:hypothetical protein [Flavobacterium branchiicola]|uniref:Uncharacterized protein n=1 Tax=Flavobacterium branchiicola TaxID=1114875 RepID=A0ABV9PFF0_9FLAO|nr:hypothetical protein [Flavobacterium branchiicola]MBS7254608.1 hypothetical protein [Flavobacterium branchiicola]
MLLDISIDSFLPPYQRSFNLKKYSLGVNQYFPDCFYKNSRIIEEDFSLDIIDLSYSTARTLCSYHLTDKELYFDVLASMLSHLNFIDSTTSNFLLSESRYKRLRDFSKNTRIGEMAQGVNALFVAKRLDFPYIIDFDLAKEKTINTLGIQSSGKTPDFVVLNRTGDKIGLFESKGTMTGTESGKYGFLSDAMEQIDAVERPCFDYALPVCTKFENNNDHSPLPLPTDIKSSINYALIEKKCAERKDTALLIKLHYASWFYLVGDFDRVTSILNEGIITPIQDENDPIYELDTETDKNNPIYWVERPMRLLLFAEEYGSAFRLFITSRYFRRGEFKIGIYKKVIESLIKTNDTNTILQLPDGEIEYLKKYPDGTLLYIKPNK